MRSSVDEFRDEARDAKPLVRAYHTAAQTIANDTLTPATFDTDVYDRFGMHAAGTPTRFHVKVPGIYGAIGSCIFVADAVGARLMRLIHYDSADAVRTILTDDIVDASATEPQALQVFGVSIPADIGDYFVFNVYQNSGGDLDLTAAAAATQGNQSAALWWIAGE